MTPGEEQEIRDSFRLFQDSIGLVHLEPNPTGLSSDNGPLFLAEKILCFKELGILNDIDDCQYYQAMMYCEIEPGLFKRSAVKTNQEGWDNYVARAAISKLIGTYIGRDNVLDYGKKHWWYFNNEVPGTLRMASGGLNYKAWLGRYPQFIAHIYHSCDVTPPLLTRLGWLCHVYSARWASPNNLDFWILTYFMCLIAPEPQHWVVKQFYTYLHKYYPKGLQGVLQQYMLNPEQPIRKYFPAKELE